MADHQNQRGQQYRGAHDRQKDAQIQAVKRLNIANQPGQHVAGLAEPQTTGRCARQPAEEPDAQVGQRPESRAMGYQPFRIPQHDPSGTEAAQDGGKRKRSGQDRGTDGQAGHRHQPDAGSQCDQGDQQAAQQPPRLPAP